MISDKDILQAITRDADGGFRLLMRTYMEPVYWHVRRMVVCHEDAQDVMDTPEHVGSGGRGREPLSDWSKWQILGRKLV